MNNPQFCPGCNEWKERRGQKFGPGRSGYCSQECWDGMAAYKGKGSHKVGSTINARRNRVIKNFS